jgi:hypothetical protein
MLDVYTFAERQKIGKGIMGHWRALVRGPNGYNSDLGIWGSGDLGIWGSGDLGIWGSGDRVRVEIEEASHTKGRNVPKVETKGS